MQRCFNNILPQAAHWCCGRGKIVHDQTQLDKKLTNGRIRDALFVHSRLFHRSHLISTLKIAVSLLAKPTAFAYRKIFFHLPQKNCVTFFCKSALIDDDGNSSTLSGLSGQRPEHPDLKPWTSGLVNWKQVLTVHTAADSEDISRPRDLCSIGMCLVKWIELS